MCYSLQKLRIDHEFIYLVSRIVLAHDRESPIKALAFQFCSARVVGLKYVLKDDCSLKIFV